MAKAPILIPFITDLAPEEFLSLGIKGDIMRMIKNDGRNIPAVANAAPEKPSNS